MLFHNSFQVAIIVLGALTPILLWGPDLPRVLQALPSALAAVAAGVSGTFHWRENWASFSSIREALKSERIKYLTRTTDDYSATQDDYWALDHFVERIEALTMSESRSGAPSGWEIPTEPAKSPHPRKGNCLTASLFVAAATAA